MSSCYVNEKLDQRSSCDHGFMGRTHALSAVAVYLIIVAFFPKHVYTALGSDNIWVLILSIGVMVGASLLPDLDNTASTSKSSLGILGELLSAFFRVTSAIIQTTLRSKYDKAEPNPHRGFYHTTVSCILMGLLVFLVTSLNVGSLNVPKIGTITYGTFAAIIIAWLNIHLTFAGLAKEFVKKVKKQAGIFGELVAFGGSLLLTVAIFTQLPNTINYWWLGVSVAFGCFIHIFGDCFTTAGSPILFPLKVKGKRWYDIRFTGIHAGGVVENYLFIPFFGLVIIIALIKIIGY